MTRVRALVPYPLGRVGGQRYRIEQWARHLAPHGVELTLSPFLSARGLDVLYAPGRVARKTAETLRGYAHRLAERALPAGEEVVYVFREAALLGPPWLERLHARRRPVVFDFDDAIYLADTSPANAWARALKPAGKAAALCGLARHVIAGNEVLAGFAAVHARRVTVVPSTVDTDEYQVRARPPNGVPVVGWTGSLTTLPHLLALAPALRRLRARVPFELRVIGGHVEVPGLDVRCLPWRPQTEVEDLRPIDVGVMPLPDDDWSRGKCGMKALQYMALGVPAVVSPVGANAVIVSHGVSGLHARTDDEWVDALAELLRDAGLRARLGAAARETVERCYSARVQAPRVAAVFREAAG
ncbi:MAG TPA: glycosyltransferase family 4 protein [Vicinamibacteria bacterium]